MSDSRKRKTGNGNLPDSTEQRLARLLLEDCRMILAKGTVRSMLAGDWNGGKAQLSASYIAKRLAYVYDGGDMVREVEIDGNRYSWGLDPGNVFRLYHNLCKNCRVREEKFGKDGEKVQPAARKCEVPVEHAGTVDDSALPTRLWGTNLLDFCGGKGSAHPLSGVWYRNGMATATDGCVCVKVKAEYGKGYECCCLGRDGKVRTGEVKSAEKLSKVYVEQGFSSLGLTLDIGGMQQAYQHGKTREDGWFNAYVLGGRMYDCRLMKPVLRLMKKHGQYSVRRNCTGVIRFSNDTYDILVAPLGKVDNVKVVMVVGQC